MIGALLRVPWERVVRRMFERLHAAGFDDLDMAQHASTLGAGSPLIEEE